MLAVAAVGLLVNILSALFLHHHSKEDINIRGVFLHMVADSASSVGVLLAGVLVLMFKWQQADPLIAAGISVMIVVWSVGLMRDSVRILLESVPKHMSLEEIRAKMETAEGPERKAKRRGARPRPRRPMCLRFHRREPETRTREIRWATRNGRRTSAVPNTWSRSSARGNG